MREGGIDVSEMNDVSPSSNIANSLTMARDLESLSEVLSKLTTSEVVSDEKIRIALKHRSFEIMTVSRRNRIEGRPLDSLRWITSFPEFLLENPLQQEIRLSGLGRNIFDDFVNILDSENRSVVEYKEVLRAIGTIPGFADVVWQ
jgi:hypothetical protein